MGESPKDKYQKLLVKQRAMNQQTWHRLQELGVTPATSLRLDFSYRAPDRKSAEALKDLLVDQTDYDIAVSSSGPMLSKQWTVQGTTQSTTISPEILDQWIDWMVSAGLERECEFDGWGTEVNPSGA
jgi:Regulator of ribonuclease activity B